jgi:AGZA family xanthine/uracil permease-like MFS transporter
MKPLREHPLYADAVGGVTTFVTMAYIVVVNPDILSGSGTGMPFSGVMTATVFVAASMTLLMGLYARLPFAVAPGMGLNAFFAFTLVLGNHVPWPAALGIVFWAGVLFVVVSVTSLREQIALAIPSGLRAAAAAGIGLLLTFLGLRNAGIIAADPATLVRMGTLDFRAVLLLLGILVAVLLIHRQNPLAYLSAIATVTGLAWLGRYAQLPQHVVSAPDFSSTFLALDLTGALHLSLLPAMVAILFTDLFDSLSTFIGVAGAAGLTDESGRPFNLRRGLIVDAVAPSRRVWRGLRPARPTWRASRVSAWEADRAAHRWSRRSASCPVSSSGRSSRRSRCTRLRRCLSWSARRCFRRCCGLIFHGWRMRSLRSSPSCSSR